MERVLIVAKTHMGPGKACVGALSLRTFKNVRLRLPGDTNHPADTPFDVGQVWNVDLGPANKLTPPHTEDMVMHTGNYVQSYPYIRDTLLQHIEPWKGGLTQLFDGCLQSDGRGCYISHNGGVPSCSTGYWLTTLPLTLTSIRDKAYYSVLSVVHKGQEYYRGTFSIPYVGFADPIPTILANTLVRVSLARWWQREVYCEERCYLQISGWYL